jgi:peroxiredoxin
MSRYAVIVFLSCAAALQAQGPQELLQSTAGNYRQLDSYHIRAHMAASVAGSSWQYRLESETAAAGPAFIPAGSPVRSIAETSRMGNGRVTVPPSSPGAPAMALPVPGRFDQLDANVKSVRSSGSDTLILDGQRVLCDVIEVSYDRPSIYEPRSRTETVQYCISAERRLVLREKWSVPDDVNPQRAINWTYSVDAVTLHQPPPQWLLDMTALTIGQARQDWIGRPAPDFSLPDLAGHATTLASFRGKAVLLSFFGTWWMPYGEQMPYLEKLRAKYGPRGLELLHISADMPGFAGRFMARFQPQPLTLLDPARTVFRNFDVTNVPLLILIGRDGRVVRYWIGLQYDSELRSSIERTLN